MARTIGTDCYCMCCGNGLCDGHETHQNPEAGATAGTGERIERQEEID